MSRVSRFHFRLYVADNTINSLQAIANLQAMCQRHLADRHEIEIVDVFKQPKRALKDGIRMTPALLKLSPLPPQTIIGTLGQSKLLLRALGMEPLPP